MEISTLNEVATFRRIDIENENYSFKVDRDFFIDKYSYLISNRDLDERQIRNLQIEFASIVLIDYNEIDLTEVDEIEINYNPK